MKLAQIINSPRRNILRQKLSTDLILLVQAPSHHHSVLLHVLQRSEAMVLAAVNLLHFYIGVEDLYFIGLAEFSLTDFAVVRLG